MMKEFLLVALIVCAVVADKYWCPDAGQPFECYESDATARFCLTNNKESKVICSKCRRKYEYCKNNLSVSKRPDYDCKAGWQNTPCTEAISEVPNVM